MEIILFCSELDNICEYKKVFHVASLEGTLTVPLILDSQKWWYQQSHCWASLTHETSNLQTIQTLRNIASMAF